MKRKKKNPERAPSATIRGSARAALLSFPASISALINDHWFILLKVRGVRSAPAHTARAKKGVVTEQTLGFKIKSAHSSKVLQEGYEQPFAAGACAVPRLCPRCFSQQQQNKQKKERKKKKLDLANPFTACRRAVRAPPEFRWRPRASAHV